MSDERDQRAAEIFADALEQPPEEHRAFLDQACGADLELRSEVESLLAAHPRAAEIMSRAARSLQTPAEPGADAGRVVGSYRLASLIASGGMASVYLADRVDREYEKRVAVKLIRPGLDTEEILARFRNERQVLADLEHPNIARLLDGGSTPDGLPYLVMEYVDGERIHRYCDEHRLPIRERLALFLQVCDAVQYAHRNMVVHRDLKPSNILVDRAGQVKLLDFGIAKVLEPAGSHDLDATMTSFRALTPRYASPEQFRGRRVTAATDVYSLGVVLYELLAGALPYVTEGATPTQVERMICEETPARMSRAVLERSDGVGEQRGATRQRLAQQLAGDLDTIVLRALSKEPERRYPSVEEFAADIRRHLGGFPVLARPDTAAYRFSKFVRRNSALVAGVASVIVILAVALATTWAAYRRALASAERERKESAKVAAVNSFLQEVLASSNPWMSGGKDITVREVIDIAAKNVDAGSLQAEPEIEATVRAQLGRQYRIIGDFSKAERFLQRAIDLHRQTLGPGHPEVATSLVQLARLWDEQGKFALAESLQKEALSIRVASLGRVHRHVAQSLNDLSNHALRRREFDTADTLCNESLAIVRTIGGESDLWIGNCLTILARVAQARGDYARADSLYHETLAFRRRHSGPQPYLASTLGLLSDFLRKRGNLTEAEQLGLEGLEINRKAVGDSSLPTAFSLNNVGRILNEMGEIAGAESLLTAALAMESRQYGDDHLAVAISLNDLGRARHLKGDLAGADSLLRESLAINRRAAEHPDADVGAVLLNLGELSLEREDVAGAESLLLEALALGRVKVPARHPDLAPTLHSLGECLVRQGRFAEAEPLLRESLSICDEDLLPESALRWRVMSALGASLAGQRRFDEAESLLVAGAESAMTARHATARDRRETLARVVSLYSTWGQPDKAAQWRRRERELPAS